MFDLEVLKSPIQMLDPLMTNSPTTTPPSRSGTWIWLAAIVGGIVLVAQCDGKSNLSSSTSPPVSIATAPAVAAPTPSDPPVTDLAASDLKLGRAAFGKVSAINDPASAVIYSKNCYAALEAAFSWAKVDRCGAFDAIVAGHALADEFAGSASDIAYFESEAAAQRYLSAGTEHGAAPGLMDVRWSSLNEVAQGYVHKALAAAAARETAEAAVTTAAQNIEEGESGITEDLDSQDSPD